MANLKSSTLKNLVLLGCLSSSWAARAQLFQITNRQYGNVPAAFKTEVDAVFDALETQVNTQFPNVDASTYVKGIANSTVLSGAGLGADYSTPFSLFVLGGGLGVAADLGNAKLTDLIKGSGLGTVSGAALQTAYTLGVHGNRLNLGNWGPIDTKRLKFFLSFASKSSSFDQSGGGTVTIGFKSYGARAQYSLVPARSVGFGALRWGGVDLTSGLNYASMNFGVSTPVSKSQQSSLSFVPGATMTTTFDALMSITASASTFTIPIEVSSSVKVLYLFTLYGGLASDISLGSSKASAGGSGPVVVTESSGTLGTISADAALAINNTAKPTPLNLRYFAGAQFDLFILAVNLQFNQALTTGTLGAEVGAKAYW